MKKYSAKIYRLMNDDWKQFVLDWWHNISPLSKKSFLWIFGIVNLVFLWHTITFFWGNHDWNQIKYGLHLGWSYWDGRWGAGVIQQITGGDILPVWNNLFCFAGFTLAVIFLAKYWELPKNVFIYTIFGLFIILMPYTNPWLQYVRSETHFWNVFLIVFSLYICSFKKLWLYCLAFLLLFFCLGCYAAMIPTIFIIFLGRCVLDIWFDNKTLNQILKDRWKTALVILLSISMFLIIWNISKYNHLFINYVTVDNVNINTFLNNLANIGTGIRDSFLHELPFIPTGFKIFLGLAVPVVIFLMFKFSKKHIASLCLLFIAILISTQITNLLSVEDYTNILRIDFWSMPYTYALFWTILLKSGKWKENIAILFICTAIYYSGLQDIRDQKVKYFDKLHDMRIMEDVISRIKANPEFNPDKTYKLIMLGSMQDSNKITIFDKYNSDITSKNAWAPLFCSWNAYEHMNFYEKHPYIKKYVTFFPCCDYLTDDELRSADINYLFYEAQVYPNLGSTHIDRDYIYIIFDQNKLNELRKRISNL